MNKKIYTIIGIILVMVLAYTGIAATYYLTKTNQLEGEQETIDTDKIDYEDIIKDWKMYRSEEYKFEIKYPPTLTASAFYGPDQINFKKNSEAYYSVGIFELSGEILEDGRKIPLVNLPLKEQLIRMFEIECPDSNFQDINWKSIKLGEIDGLQAFTVNDVCVKRNLPWSSVINHNRRYSIISYKGPTEEYNQILSTFKFIE